MGDLTISEAEQVVKHLPDLYGSGRDVAEETGLSLAMVQLYLKAAGLHPRLWEMVDHGGLDLESALHAQDVATEPSDIVDEEMAIDVARSTVIEVISSCPPKRKPDDKEGGL